MQVESNVSYVISFFDLVYKISSDDIDKQERFSGSISVYCSRNIIPATAQCFMEIERGELIQAVCE